MNPPTDLPSVTLRMSELPADHRRYCGLQEDGTVRGGACGCMGCANWTVTLDEFKAWVAAGRPVTDALPPS